jgi:hypothetical protein
MNKLKWFTIGLFKDGQCVEVIRSFQLPVNEETLKIVNWFTGLISKKTEGFTPENHYVAFDYEGRK